MKRLGNLILTFLILLLSFNNIYGSTTIYEGFRTLTENNMGENEAVTEFQEDGTVHVTYYIRTDLDPDKNAGRDFYTLDEFKQRFIGAEKLMVGADTFDPTLEEHEPNVLNSITRHWEADYYTDILTAVDEDTTYIAQHSGIGIDDVANAPSEVAVVIMLIDLNEIAYDSMALKYIEDFIRDNSLRGARFKIITFGTEHFLNDDKTTKNEYIRATYDWSYDRGLNPVPYLAVYNDRIIDAILAGRSLGDLIYGDEGTEFANKDYKYVAGGSNGVYALYAAVKEFGDLEGLKEVVLVSKHHLDIDRTSIIGMESILPAPETLHFGTGKALTQELIDATAFQWGDKVSNGVISSPYVQFSSLVNGGTLNAAFDLGEYKKNVHTIRQTSSVYRILDYIKQWLIAKQMTLRTVYPHAGHQSLASGTPNELILDPNYLYKDGYKPTDINDPIALENFYDDIGQIDEQITKNFDGTTYTRSDNLSGDINLDKDHVNPSNTLTKFMQFNGFNYGLDIGDEFVFQAGGVKVKFVSSYTNYAATKPNDVDAVYINNKKYNNASLIPGNLNALQKADKDLTFFYSFETLKQKYYNNKKVYENYLSRIGLYEDPDEYGLANKAKIQRKLDDMSFLENVFSHTSADELTNLRSSGENYYRIIDYKDKITGDVGGRILLVYYPITVEGKPGTSETRFGLIAFQTRADGMGADNKTRAQLNTLVQRGVKILTTIPYLGYDRANTNVTGLSNPDTGEISLTQLSTIDETNNLYMYDYELGSTDRGVYEALRDIFLGPKRQYWQITYQSKNTLFDGYDRSVDGVVYGLQNNNAQLSKLGYIDNNGNMTGTVHPYLYYNLPLVNIVNETSKRLFTQLKDIHGNLIPNNNNLYEISSADLEEKNIGIKNGDIISLTANGVINQYKVGINSNGSLEIVELYPSNIDTNIAKAIITKLNIPIAPKVTKILSIDDEEFKIGNTHSGKYIGIRSKVDDNNLYRLDLSNNLGEDEIGVIVKIKHDGYKSDYAPNSGPYPQGNIDEGFTYIYIPKGVANDSVNLHKYAGVSIGSLGMDGEYTIFDEVIVVNNAGDLSTFLAGDTSSSPTNDHNLALSNFNDFYNIVYTSNNSMIYSLDTIGPRLDSRGFIKLSNKEFDNTSIGGDGLKETLLLDHAMDLPQIINGAYPLKDGDSLGINIADYNYVVYDGATDVGTNISNVKTGIGLTENGDYLQADVSKYYSTNDVTEFRIRPYPIQWVDMTVDASGDLKRNMNHLVVYTADSNKKFAELLTTDLALNGRTEVGSYGYVPVEYTKPGNFYYSSENTYNLEIPGDMQLIGKIESPDAPVKKYSIELNNSYLYPKIENKPVSANIEYKSVFTDFSDQQTLIYKTLGDTSLYNYKVAITNNGEITDQVDWIFKQNEKNGYILKTYSLSGNRSYSSDHMIYDNLITPNTLQSDEFQYLGNGVYRVRVPLEKLYELSGISDYAIYDNGITYDFSKTGSVGTAGYFEVLQRDNKANFINTYIEGTMNPVRNVNIVKVEVEDRLGNTKVIELRFIKRENFFIKSKSNTNRENETNVEIIDKIKIRSRK